MESRWEIQFDWRNTPFHDVIKWKHFPRYWTFVRSIHRSPIDSPNKSQWRGAFVFSLIRAWKSGSANNRNAGDLRRHRTQYDVTVMCNSSRNVQNAVSNWNTCFHKICWRLNLCLCRALWDIVWWRGRVILHDRCVLMTIDTSCHFVTKIKSA